MKLPRVLRSAFPTSFNGCRARLAAALVALAALAFGPQQAQAAVTEAWVHRFSNIVSNSVDRPLKVVRDGAGDVIVTGNSNDNSSGPDMLTIKYSGADGSVVWQQRRRYSGPTERRDHTTMAGVGIAVDVSNNVVVTGSVFDDNQSDYYTVKYAAATGSPLWAQRYNGSLGDDEATAVAVDGSGNVVVTGSTATLKYAAVDGTLLWEQRSAAGNINQTALAVDGNGNVVVTGVFYSITNSDYHTAKYAAVDGALLWEKRYDSPGNGWDRANAVAVDGSGNVVVTGSTATLKYAAADGALLWEKRDSDVGAADQTHALAVDNDGNVVVTRGSSNDQSSSDYYTVKYASADGALLWEKRYDGPANRGSDNPQALALDASGNVMVTGCSSNPSETSEKWQLVDYYTAKYAAADGALIWEKRYNSLAVFWSDLGGTAAAAVTTDGSGNVVITGPTFSNEAGRLTANSDYYTAKYGAADGALLWEKRYNGPAYHESFPGAVTMDRSGNVVVTATSENDFYTAKYAASNGALLWEKRGPGQVTQIVTDDNGNVLVTGLSYDGSGSGSDFYTAKYAPDGALLWERRSPGGGAQVALDASGNAVVAGFSGDPIGSASSTYYTAKYAAASGALLWEKRYSGPGNADQAHAVAVDNHGNVAVTGSSATSARSRHDYYTAKYAAADGALLWEKRYNGSAYSEDAGRAVAMDSSGNVVVMGSNATLKYAAADGVLLWVKRYSGTRALALDGNGNVVITGEPGTLKFAAADGALLWLKRFVSGTSTAVMVDGRGNVVVAGESYKGNSSLYTAKYAAADGSLLWEKSYNEAAGFSNLAGGSHSLALGPNGLVAITGRSIPSTTGAEDVLTVVYREALPSVAIALVPVGARLHFTGIAGQSYSIQRAPVVTGPWNTINTQTAPSSGLIQYEDGTQTPGAAFYRTTTP